VKFRRIICNGEAGAYFYRYPRAPLAAIDLEDVSICMERMTDWPGAYYNRRKNIRAHLLTNFWNPR
jgi:hypothetical protein